MRLERLHLLAHNNAVFSAAFSPDGKKVATASLDNTVKLWTVEDGQHVGTLKGHGDGVSFVGYLADGRIVTTSLDRSVRVWPADGSSSASAMTGHQDYVPCGAASRTSHLIVSGGFDKTVRLWDSQTSAAVAVFTGHEANVQAVAISNGGKWVASGGDDNSVRIWSVETKQLLKSIAAHSRAVEGIAISADDRLLASVAADGLTRLWTAAGEAVGEFPVANCRLKSVAFSPYGSVLLTGGSDGILRSYDVASRRLLQELPAHKNTIYGVALSPDGKRVASASFDRTIQLWRVA